MIQRRNDPRSQKQLVGMLFFSVLLMLFAMLTVPGARQVGFTEEAMLYSLEDATFAEAHTVTIAGYDSRSMLGYGDFLGTIAVSGWDFQDAHIDIEFPVNGNNVHYRDADGNPMWEGQLKSAAVDRSWDHFVAALVPPEGDKVLVLGAESREAALQLAAEMLKSK